MFWEISVASLKMTTTTDARQTLILILIVDRRSHCPIGPSEVLDSLSASYVFFKSIWFFE